MYINALYRATVYACVLAISLSLDAGAVGYNTTYKAANSSISSEPALGAFVREVLDSNPGVQAAEAAVNTAQALTRAASRPLYNPELQVQAEQAIENTGALGLSQTIDWADKRTARTQMASFDEAAARAKLTAVRQRVAGELLTALSRFRTAKPLLRLAEHRLNLTRRFAALSEQRYSRGDLNRVDLELARLAHAQAKLQRAQAMSNVIRAREALAAVAGVVNRSWPQLPTVLPSIRRSAVDIERLLNDLPIIRVYRAQMAAANAFIDLRVRLRRSDPTISVLGGAQQETEAGTDPLIGLNLSVPLFVRNNFSAEVDAANTNFIRIQRQGQDAYRRARARLISALAQYRVTQSARQAWKQSGQKSLTVQIDLLRRLWQIGELGATNFLVQLNQALSTQASAIELRGSAWLAWFRWLTASGKIDTWLGLRRL